MDEDDIEPAHNQTPTKGKGLRSPLLSGGDDDDDAPQSPSNRGRGLRSPLLSGQDEEESIPRQRASGRLSKSGSLRSPLLSGDDDDFDFLANLIYLRRNELSFLIDAVSMISRMTTQISLKSPAPCARHCWVGLALTSWMIKTHRNGD